MKKILLSLILAFVLVTTPFFVSAQAQTVDNTALIESLLKIILQLQQELSQLLTQAKNALPVEQNTSLPTNTNGKAPIIKKNFIYLTR